jgi:tetratricopeptide (TPR) repeat protein
MIPDDPSGTVDLPATLAERWDLLCDRFEDGWKEGRRPRIEDFLGDMPEPGRPALLRELLGLEMSYRHAHGERPGPEEYLARFPDFAAAIGAVFDETRRSPDPPPMRRIGTSEAGLNLLSGPGSRWLDLIGPGILSAMERDPAPPDPHGRGGAGRFRILRPHARGGLGAVFVARDEELNREVALKQIQERFAADPVSRARFLAEAVITGGLEHPGVVPVYGLGWHDGRPFYAMRLIRGESLKQAIDRFHEAGAPGDDPGARTLALRKLLGRFVSVCDAVAYAHSRGVLHRDLKPGNVMLGPYGETLVVDWGLAVPLATPTGEDVGTARPPSAGGDGAAGPGSVVGTPAFMSPEQAAGDRDRLGAASDVYSLGATLYCLLTGEPPFQGPDVAAALGRVRRGDFAPPARVDPGVDRALEAVCLKAMALDPAGRYPSPRALADDVERWLADEPVSVGREPLARRARRWARRHRTAVAAAAVALLASVVGLAAMASVQSRANRALKLAKKATEDALARSEEARERAEGVMNFLKGDILAAARPEGQAGGQGVSTTIRQAVDAAEPKVAARFKDQPLTEAEVRGALGETYWYLGEHTLAIRQLGRALEIIRAKLGPDHPETLVARNNLALAFSQDGRYDDAVRMHVETLKLMTARLGPDDPRTLSARNNLATAYNAAGRPGLAIPLLESTLKAREARLGPEDTQTFIARINLAAAYDKVGRTAEAIRMQERALRRLEATLGPDNPYTLDSRGFLATAYRSAGRAAEAIKLDEETLSRRTARLGPEHPDTLASRNNLAEAHRAAGRPTEAIRMHEETLRLGQARLGPDHPDMLSVRSHLAMAYADVGRVQEAVRLLEETLKLCEARLGPEHLDTLIKRNNLATAYRAVGRASDAARMLEGTLRLLEARLGPDHPLTLTSRGNLAAVYADAGRWDDAIRLEEGTLNLREARGADHPDTLLSRNNLATDYFQSGRRADAVALWEGTLPVARRVLGADHPNTLTFTANLASAQESLGRWGDAEAYRREILSIRRKADPAGGLALASALAGLGTNLLGQSRYGEAEPLLREALAIRAKGMPDDWLRFNAMSLLGGALLGQGKYAEAEPLVVQGYEGIRAREAKIFASDKSRLHEAAARLVGLYEAWGKADQAAEWKTRIGLTGFPSDVFARP